MSFAAAAAKAATAAAAEAALAAKIPPGTEMDEWSRNLVGKIAVARSMLAATLYDAETSLDQARRALEYLHLDNLPFRSRAIWTLGFAYQLQGDRAAAPAPASGGFEVKVPMPGKVVNIVVKPGDLVKKGDRLFVLEPSPTSRVRRAVPSSGSFDRGPRPTSRKPCPRCARPQGQACGALRAALSAGLRSPRAPTGPCWTETTTKGEGR